MFLTRTLRPFLTTAPRLALPPSRPTRAYATDTAKTNADGASDKSMEDAKPKILDRSPPKDHKASDEVKEHNKEMANRAEKPNETVKEEDVAKDKVSKTFWKGQAGTSE